MPSFIRDTGFNLNIIGNFSCIIIFVSEFIIPDKYDKSMVIAIPIPFLISIVALLVTPIRMPNNTPNKLASATRKINGNNLLEKSTP